jgi:uroporphyrin-III C-methyltransferase / precorrin-2 dehydrogenase / sirohydrochlorin ferrochelatase
MNQLPLFVNVKGQRIVLIGDGEAAMAKRRLIERAGGICVDDCPKAICVCARIAFVAIEDEAAALDAATRLRAKGMQVNVVDRPDHCDFTTPAIIDRDPVLLAVSTGGASAGMAKAIRQRLEAMLPQSLGKLALAVSASRDAIRTRWPGAAERRRALDAAFQPGGALDPMAEQPSDSVTRWLSDQPSANQQGLVEIRLTSPDPEDLTLRTARLLGEADHIFHDVDVPASILNRARADAARHAGAPGARLPQGLTLYLILPHGA